MYRKAGRLSDMPFVRYQHTKDVKPGHKKAELSPGNLGSEKNTCGRFSAIPSLRDRPWAREYRADFLSLIRLESASVTLRRGELTS